MHFYFYGSSLECSLFLSHLSSPLIQSVVLHLKFSSISISDQSIVQFCNKHVKTLKSLQIKGNWFGFNYMNNNNDSNSINKLIYISFSKLESLSLECENNIVAHNHIVEITQCCNIKLKQISFQLNQTDEICPHITTLLFQKCTLLQEFTIEFTKSKSVIKFIRNNCNGSFYKINNNVY